MPSPLRIGLDLDGVIIDHRDHKCRLAREFGVGLERWQSNSNVIKGFIPGDVYGAFQERLYMGMTPDAPPVAGALEMIAALPGEKFIISARRPQMVRFAQEWLTRNDFLDLIPAENIFFCGDEGQKAAICKRLGVEVYLDDKTSVLETLPESIDRFLFDEDEVAGRITVPAGIRIVTTWPDFHKNLEAALDRTNVIKTELAPPDIK